MKGELRFRRAEAADGRFLLDSVSREGWNYTLDEILSYGEPGGDGWLVAELGGRPVGHLSTVACGPDYRWLGNVAVLPEFRGRGIGREMVAGALRRLSDEGVRTVRLHSTLAARRLYLSAGFSEEVGCGAGRLLRPAEGGRRKAGLWPVWGFVGTAVPPLHYTRSGSQGGRSPRAEGGRRSVAVESVGAAGLDSVLGTDLGVFGADRKNVLRAILASGRGALLTAGWKAPEGPSGPFGGFRGAKPPEGYAVVKRFSDMAEVGPLVCAGVDIARSLLSGCLALSGGFPVEMSVYSGHDRAMRLAASLGFRDAYSTVRMVWGAPRPGENINLTWAIGALEKG